MPSGLRPLACLLLLVAGCRDAQPLRAPDAPPSEADGTTETAPGAQIVNGEPTGGEAPATDSGAESGAGSGAGVGSGAQTEAGAGVVPAPGSERHGPPLPELRVKSFGLHVGGTARDAAAREDFLKALERNSWRYLECYQLIEQPGSEGTFGADLRVGAEGGKPAVSGVRTKLKGAEFRSCMERALESTKFEPAPSGRSVVVSYSLKFSFAW
jgi:hypothetical protein